MDLTPEQAERLHQQLVEAGRLSALGEFQKARAACEKVLASCPGHSDAHQVLGLICQQEKQPADAVAHFKKSLAGFPDQPQLWLRVGYLSLQLENPAAAKDAFLETLARDPVNGFALRFLADLAKAEDVPPLLELFEGAFADPNLKDAAQKLQVFEGMAALFGKTGNAFMAESYRAFSEILKGQIAGKPLAQGPVLPPESRERVKGEILRAHDYLKAENVSRAGKICRKVIEEFPGQPDALQLLAAVASANFQQEQAAAYYRQSLKSAPTQGSVWKKLAGVLLMAKKPGACREALLAAIALDPADVEALNSLGMLKVGEGELSRARAYIERAIAADPGFAPSYSLLLQIKGFKPDAAFISQLEQLAHNPSTIPDHAVVAFFALGKYFEKQGEDAKFLSCVRAANRMQAALASNKLNALPAALNLSREVFTRDMFRDAVPETHKELTPIFIVGLPRSGTTLVEQILGCHPQIFPGDELQTLVRELVMPLEVKTGKNYPLGLKGIDPSALVPLVKAYQDAMRGYSKTHPFITDKKFDNLFYLGMVRKALPWAKVVWLRRNLLDNAFSIVTNHFSTDIRYSFDQKELVTFFRMCFEARVFWREVMDDFILDVGYEDIVRNPEPEIRKILDFIGVPFDPACLKFHESKRPALTLSMTQVQQPIYTSSIGKWKKYPGLLDEFREGIADLIDADGYLKG